LAQDDNSPGATEQESETLSPVKRALGEIRLLRTELEECRRSQSQPVAIVGLAVRLPGGVITPELFWDALAEGKDLIASIPPERWEAQEYWSPEGDQPGTLYDNHGGFLSDVDAFDADFFGINAREATSMDPQQRILLELTWEALERAAIDPRSLLNTQTGIFLGISNSDYGRMLIEEPCRVDGYTGVGAAASIAAGRLAYFLGTHGPAVVLDTACSSSLVAVHEAVQSLRRRETSLSIAGGSNLILSPEFSISFSRSRMLSRSGRCRAFSASADGYVRAEGCCVVVLKLLEDAIRDRDRIMATILGTAVNQDGRSAGITAPNGPAQEAVMRAALKDAGIAPTAVSYVEAHGTGTPLGDPMEFQAIGAVYGPGRESGSPLRIGSVKTNLGHTEAAAGLAGLIKVILMMKPGHSIAPNLHFDEPSPQVDWSRWPIEIPVQLNAWNEQGVNRYAGVSSFGFSGTNAHVILTSADDPPTNGEIRRDSLSQERQESLLCLSASQEPALRALAERYVDYLRRSKEPFHDICHTALIGRAKLNHRLALRASTASAAAQMLERWLSGDAVPGVMTTGTDGLTESLQSTDDRDSLFRVQQEFVEGRSSRYRPEFTTGDLRRVDLPVYPFQRKRFWFGGPLAFKRQREREDAWRLARTAATRQSTQAPLGWHPEQYPSRWKALERLTIACVRNVLIAEGAFRDPGTFSTEEVMIRCGFQPIYRKLIERWLSSLVVEGALAGTSQGFHTTGLQPADLDLLWRDVEQCMFGDPGALAYLKQCGALLGEVVTGRKSALETIFPDGSFALAEGIYESSEAARYTHPIIASAIRETVRALGRKRNVHILEVGGGTGGTTSAILPVLPAKNVEYLFTDVSELFLGRAQNRFAQYDFVRYAIFDVDRGIEKQGLVPHSFDIIVAANVIHAARNLADALNRLDHLLCPGGILILLETTEHHAWFDMSTGLIEGWQNFDDLERKEHPLLTPDRWRDVLERVGFEDVLALPGSESLAANIGQHVLLARRRYETAGQLRNETKTEPLASRSGDRQSATQGVPLGRSKVGDELLALRSGTLEQRVSILTRETICRVFRLEARAEEIGDRDRLSDLGMDSLIALELKAELSKALGLEGRLSSTIAFDSGTVGELVRTLTALVITSTELKPVLPQKKQQEFVNAEQLEVMSDEEVEQLLRERLSKQ